MHSIRRLKVKTRVRVDLGILLSFGLLTPRGAAVRQTGWSYAQSRYFVFVQGSS